MRFRNLASLSLAIAFAPAAAFAQTVQTFEDAVPCDGFGSLGAYGPVNYNHQFTCYSTPQFPYTPHSGTNRVYAGNETIHNLTSGTFNFTGGPVVFNGAWFSGYPTNAVSFALWLGGVPVWASGPLNTSDVPTFLSSGYSGLVDRVDVNGTSVQWVMDDVTFNSSSSTVPEPASLTLLGTGLVGLYGAARRRRNRAA